MKRFAFFLILIASCMAAMSQVPQAFNYQAVVRNSSGEIVPNKSVSFRISILSGSETGNPVYSEIHSANTNDFGLANLKIGKGGNTSGVFSPGGWGVNSHFIKVELDINGGATFSHMGTSQLLSVPYAFHAQTVEEDNVDDDDADSENELQELQLSGTILSISKMEGSVTLPSTGGGDNWGTDVVTSDATLEGEGTTAAPLKIAQQGAAEGYVLKWNGTMWVPTEEDNPDDDPENEIQELSLTGTDLTLSKEGGTVDLSSLGGGGGDNWGTDVVVSNATLEGEGTAANPLKLAHQGAAEGNVLKWTGTEWAPTEEENPDSDPANEIQELSFSGTDLTLSKEGGTVDLSSLGGELSLPVNKEVSHGVVAFSISNDAGIAIRGQATDPSPHGITMGVNGVAYYENGVGVSGTSYNNSGYGVGVYGQSNSTDAMAVKGVAGGGGYSGHFTGGRFYINHYLGIGVSSPTSNLDMTGQIRIRGGSPGSGKVLTSDASGLASWETPSGGGGISIPHRETYDTPDPLFLLENNGTGQILYGESHATSGYVEGAYLRTHSIDGAVMSLHSAANSGYTTAIRAKVDSPDGHAGYFIGRVYVNGKLGIGIAYPAASFDTQGQIKIRGGSPGAGKVLTSDAGGLATWETPSGGSSLWSESGPNIYFNTGSVGIGTNSPTVKLEVSGDITLSSGGNRYISLPDGSNSLFIGGRVGATAPYAIQLVTNGGSGGAERMTIKSDKVGVGTTTPTQTLDVNGNARFRSIGSGASVGVVNRTSDGTLTTSTSDIRLKENIKTLKGSLGKVMKLRGVNFTWRNNPEYGNRIGFIAQEFEEVIPELVFTNPSDGYKGINYAEVSAILVESVKELKAENDMLKDQNERIMKRLEKLENLFLSNQTPSGN